MNAIVSIILPIYNAGSYLIRCLDSLVNQTLKEIEIIAILDCPTDGSDKIVKEYAKKFPQIVVIENKTNLHIGNSRNRGLEVASGKYICFCDHDDYYALDMCEKLVFVAEEKKVDMVVSPYVGIINEKIAINYVYPEYSESELIKAIFETSVGITNKKDPMKHFSISGVIWNKLFKNEIIKNNHIKFIDTKKISQEDCIFLTEYSYYAKSCGVINENLYFHILEIGNTGATISYNQISKIIPRLEQTYKFLTENNIFEPYKERLYNTVCVCCHLSLVATLRKVGIQGYLKTIKTIKLNYLARISFNNTKMTIFPNGNTYKSFLMEKLERLLIKHIHIF